MFSLKNIAKPLTVAAASTACLGMAVSASAQVSTNSTGTVTSMKLSPSVISQTSMDNAQTRLPMLDDISQVPGYDGNGGFTSQGYGTGSHPFTTKLVAAQTTSPKGVPVNLFPNRAAGKLFMTFTGVGTFVCSASVIRPGLVVTAAHCVHSFGTGTAGLADVVTYQPARHNASIPFGTWDAVEIFVPTTYLDGTDVCTVSGIVCENDIAIIAMDTGPAPYTGREVGNVTGRFGQYVNNQSYTPFAGFDRAGQITQLGYPASNYSGNRMLRNDSLGYQEAPNNVIIGSNMTGGSSGGPWLMNFGVEDSSFSGTPVTFNASNRVVATTSWGFVSDTIKVQGASRFAHNTAFPAPGDTNIKALIDAACAAYPGKC